MRGPVAGLAEVEHCRWFRRFVLLHASTVPQNQHNAIHKTTNACAVITPAPYPSAASRLSCRVRCLQAESQAVAWCDLYTGRGLQNRGLPSVVRFAYTATIGRGFWSPKRAAPSRRDSCKGLRVLLSGESLMKTRDFSPSERRREKSVQLT